jgi:hypothetical protein
MASELLGCATVDILSFLQRQPYPNTLANAGGPPIYGDGKRFVVRADEKLTAFMELEFATRAN